MEKMVGGAPDDIECAGTMLGKQVNNHYKSEESFAERLVSNLGEKEMKQWREDE